MLALDSIELLERFTVDQYLLMMQAGVLPEGAPVELIDGVIVRKDRRDDRGGAMVVGPRHTLMISRLSRLFEKSLSAVGVAFRVQQPLLCGETSLPEPDIAIVEGDIEDFAQEHPRGNQACLVIEVAESSLKTDRETKSVLYAAAGVPVYWIVNLVDQIIEVYSDPDCAAGRYRHQHTLGKDDEVAVDLPDRERVTIAVLEVLK